MAEAIQVPGVAEVHLQGGYRAERTDWSGPEWSDRRELQPGIVVRNTFIDVCPLEEESDGGEETSCASPHRRHLSAPPSPTRKRNPWADDGAQYEDSEQEEEEEPGAIPNYQWAADGGLVSAESPEEDRFLGGQPPVWVDHLSDDGKAPRQPSWLQAPPGSPKKVSGKLKKGRRPSEASAGARPALGEFLKGGVDQTSGTDPQFMSLAGMHGSAGTADPYAYGLPPGAGLPPSFGQGTGLGSYVGGPTGVGLDPRGLSTAPHGLGSYGGFTSQDLWPGMPPAQSQVDPFNFPFEEPPLLPPPQSLGLGAQVLSQERLATAPPANGPPPPLSPPPTEPAPGAPGAAYISDNPPPRTPLAGHIPTEAPAYILGTTSGHGSSGSANAAPVLSSQPTGEASSQASAGNSRRPSLSAGTQPWPNADAAAARCARGGPADLKGIFGGMGGETYSNAEGVPAFQIAHGMGAPSSSPGIGGDAAERSPAPEGGHYAPLDLGSGGYGLGGFPGGIASRAAATAVAGGGPWAMSASQQQGAPQPPQPQQPQPQQPQQQQMQQLQQSQQQQQHQPLQQQPPQQQQQGPWVAQGALRSIDLNEMANARGGSGRGRGKNGGTAAPAGGEAKGRVPLSGGGPKRTDYIKKYGGVPADSESAGNVPITTMMLKNIPCRKSQDEVMLHIDQKGFSNRYDFFYLPRDVKFRANLGYAFINFLTPEDASHFGAEMNGYRFSGSGSTKACAVVPAHVQGLVNNLAAFKRTEVMRSSRKPYFSGVVTL